MLIMFTPGNSINIVLVGQKLIKFGTFFTVIIIVSVTHYNDDHCHDAVSKITFTHEEGEEKTFQLKKLMISMMIIIIIMMCR